MLLYGRDKRVHHRALGLLYLFVYAGRRHTASSCSYTLTGTRFYLMRRDATRHAFAMYCELGFSNVRLLTRLYSKPPQGDGQFKEMQLY